MIRSRQEKRPFTALQASPGIRLKLGIECTCNPIPGRNGRAALAQHKLLVAIEAGGCSGKERLFFLEDKRRWLNHEGVFLRGHRSCWGSRLGHAAENICHWTPWKGALYDPYNSHFPAKDLENPRAAWELSFNLLYAYRNA